MNPVAIIPARGGSKRLARKNILKIDGIPLLVYVIRSALEAECFEQVIVSSEDSEILTIARDEGATVVERPDYLATDESTVADVCLNVLDQNLLRQSLPRYFCCLYATAIFITKQDIRASLNLLTEHCNANRLMCVSKMDAHPYQAMALSSGYLTPINEANISMKSQEMPDRYTSNGTLYWLDTRSFIESKSFYSDKMIPYEIEKFRGIDIDTLSDFNFAKLMVRNGSDFKQL